MIFLQETGFQKIINAQNVDKNMLSLELFYYSFVIFIERISFDSKPVINHLVSIAVIQYKRREEISSETCLP